MIRKLLAAALLCACAGGVDDFEGQQELGTLEEGISAKFSSTKSYGVSSNPTRSACTRAAAGGSGFKCRLPQTTNLKYRLVGSDPMYGVNNRKSWKAHSYRGINEVWGLINNGSATVPFALTEVAENDTTAHIKFQAGTCSGDAVNSTNIQTYVCTSWANDTQLTESLPGSYYRANGEMTVTFDLAKIDTRSLVAGFCGAGQDALGETSWNQIAEHGAHAAGAQVFGLGTNNNNDYWNDSLVVTGSPNGQGCYDMHTISAGDLCRARSYSGANSTLFEQGCPLCQICAD